MSTLLHKLVGDSPSALAESAVLAVVFAWIGYRMSVRHRAVRGVTPWRLPPVIWALICLLFQFLGVALELFAELTTRPALRTERASTAPLVQPVPYPPPAGPPVALPAPGGGPELLAGVPQLPLPLDGSGRIALFGWYDDPLGRHARRYFDGRFWSDLVADGDVPGSDPLPSERPADPAGPLGLNADPSR